MENKKFYYTLGICFFSAAVDLFTTKIGLTLGFTEKNPLNSLIIDQLGFNGSIIYRLLCVGAIALLSVKKFKSDPEKTSSVLLGVNVVTTFACVSNAVALLTQKPY